MKRAIPMSIKAVLTKELFILVLVCILSSLAFGQKTKMMDLDVFIKQNFTKSTKTKKQIVGKNFRCDYQEVYFVEGFKKNGKLAERYMVYKKNGVYSKSVKFLMWAGNKSKVVYEYQQPDRETEADYRDLIIKYSSGKFTIDNPKGRKAAEKAKEESNDPDYHIELPFADEVTFDEFLDDEGNCN